MTLEIILFNNTLKNDINLKYEIFLLPFCPNFI